MYFSKHRVDFILKYCKCRFECYLSFVANNVDCSHKQQSHGFKLETLGSQRPLVIYCCCEEQGPCDYTYSCCTPVPCFKNMQKKVINRMQILKQCQLFLISNFFHVLKVVCFLLGNSPASEFYIPMFRNTLCVGSS